MLGGWCGLMRESEAGSPGVRTEPGAAGPLGVITLTGVPREAGELRLVPSALASLSFLTEPGGPMDGGPFPPPLPPPVPAPPTLPAPPALPPPELPGPTLPGILSEERSPGC